MNFDEIQKIGKDYPKYFLELILTKGEEIRKVYCCKRVLLFSDIEYWSHMFEKDTFNHDPQIPLDEYFEDFDSAILYFTYLHNGSLPLLRRYGKPKEYIYLESYIFSKRYTSPIVKNFQNKITNVLLREKSNILLEVICQFSPAIDSDPLHEKLIAHSSFSSILQKYSLSDYDLKKLSVCRLSSNKSLTLDELISHLDSDLSSLKSLFSHIHNLALSRYHSPLHYLTYFDTSPISFSSDRIKRFINDKPWYKLHQLEIIEQYFLLNQ